MISVSKNVYIDKLDDILCPGHMLLMILMEKKTVGKKKSKEFRIEKVIKRKGNKLYVKWKGKLVPVSVYLSKLSDVVKNDLVEKL